jgi:hypothetical protein
MSTSPEKAVIFRKFFYGAQIFSRDTVGHLLKKEQFV